MGEKFFYTHQEKKGLIMNNNQIEGNWEQLKGQLKQWWGKLTDDDIAYINGSRQKFFGKLQERYGIAEEEAEERLKEFEKSLNRKAS